MMHLRSWPSIESLLSLRRPTAIPRGVGSIIVSAVERVVRCWFSPHVGEKVFVRIPSVVNCDAASSVEMIISDIWITAAPFHGRPSAIFGQFISFAMRGAAFAGQLASKTAARFRVAVFQAVIFDDLFASAIALAMNLSAVLMNDRPAFELLSGNKHGACLA